MRVDRDQAGDIELRHLPLICADTLMLVPELLESEDPDVRGRLFPDAYPDTAAEAEWRRFAGPELEHLFASRVEIVRKDLVTLRAESLRPPHELEDDAFVHVVIGFPRSTGRDGDDLADLGGDDSGGDGDDEDDDRSVDWSGVDGIVGGLPATYSLRIPAAHKAAWQSALTGASHALFVLNGLAPQDMELQPGMVGEDDKDLALLRIHLLGHVLAQMLEADGFRHDSTE